LQGGDAFLRLGGGGPAFRGAPGGRGASIGGGGGGTSQGSSGSWGTGGLAGGLSQGASSGGGGGGGGVLSPASGGFLQGGGGFALLPPLGGGGRRMGGSGESQGGSKLRAAKPRRIDAGQHVLCLLSQVCRPGLRRCCRQGDLALVKMLLEWIVCGVDDLQATHRGGGGGGGGMPSTRGGGGGGGVSQGCSGAVVWDQVAASGRLRIEPGWLMQAACSQPPSPALAGMAAEAGVEEGAPKSLS
jgi:hypothetical protein